MWKFISLYKKLRSHFQLCLHWWDLVEPKVSSLPFESLLDISFNTKWEARSLDIHFENHLYQTLDRRLCYLFSKLLLLYQVESQSIIWTHLKRYTLSFIISFNTILNQFWNTSFFLLRLNSLIMSHDFNNELF
jgi:hypothetical protein